MLGLVWKLRLVCKETLLQKCNEIIPWGFEMQTAVWFDDCFLHLTEIPPSLSKIKAKAMPDLLHGTLVTFRGSELPDSVQVPLLQIPFTNTGP
jgi:hypothetical protein